MKITVISGQVDANICGFTATFFKDNNITEENTKIMFFPENRIAHQEKLLNDMREVVSKCIADNKDMCIITYSDHIFNAVRLEVKKHNLTGCTLQNVLNDGTSCTSIIESDGHLNHWVDGVFDTWDNALTEILT